MGLRDLFRHKRGPRPVGRDEQQGLTEDEVRRLQSVQRTGPSAVKVLRRDQ
jgi:hypothetical protein